MLKKLLKYDLAWCYKPLIVFYILAIFFSIITRIVESFEQSLMILIIDKICSGIVISMIVSIIINNFMRVCARVIKNVYKDESYLTHTLPISKNTIYLSKVLTAIITLITSFIVIIGCIAICYSSEENWIALKSTIENSADYFEISLVSLVTVFGATVFFEFLFMQIVGIVAIIMGHRANNLKMIKSIIIGFMIYGILSTLSLGIIYIIGLFNPNIMELFNNVVVNVEAVKFVLYTGMSMYAIYNLILYFIGRRILSKGVNVD